MTPVSTVPQFHIFHPKKLIMCWNNDTDTDINL